MRFAIVDDKLTEAALGLKGACPGCGHAVVAKCGVQRVAHWAHVSKKACDSWHEAETEWHRAWKNNFSVECQEFFLTDERTGEKHIADVRTTNGLVIEFQHSHLKPEERSARENFYRNMIWVVDGTRLVRDYPRFVKGREDLRAIQQGIFRVSFPEECFSLEWVGSSVPVIFDFRGNTPLDDVSDIRNDLCLLFPQRLGRDAILATLKRTSFIEAATNGKLVSWIRSYMDWISQAQKQQAERQRLQANLNFQRLFSSSIYNRRRKFRF